MTDEMKERLQFGGAVLGFVLVTAGVAGLLFASCGDAGGGDARLERAREELSEARDRLSDSEKGLEQAGKTLEAEKADLERARAEIKERQEALLKSAEDSRIEHAVRAALLADARYIGRDLDVRVKDGVVSIRGRVAKQEDAEAAVAAIQAIKGVRSVDAKLKPAG